MAAKSVTETTTTAASHVIPFQTQEHRTLANAVAYFNFIKDHGKRRGESLDRETIIPEAVYAAVADERWGPGWRDDPEVQAAINRESMDRVRAILHDCVNRELRHWDQYSKRLEWLLARWLDGRLPRLRQRQPLRPPRRRFKRDAPRAQIIPFPAPGASPRDSTSRIDLAAATLLEKWGPEGAAGRKAQRECASAVPSGPDAA